MSLFFLIVFGSSPRDVQGISHAPPESSSIGVRFYALNMDTATLGGSATAEYNIISDKFLSTPLKTGIGYLGRESCHTCSPWLGGCGPGVVVIRLNSSTVPERNESKHPS